MTTSLLATANANDLVLIANTFRNIAGVTMETTKLMIACGVTGFAVELSFAIANHATMTANLLEERAAHMEATKITVPPAV